MVEQLTELRDANPDRRLFPPDLTIRALRDSRYHNTAYAIAELIDNSIEARAPQIELLCMEKSQLVTERDRLRVSEIAVLDNGTGMDVPTLLEALKFGGGTRHNSQRGIGKYGMGLPTASMSQCRRVDVWTWQNGVDSVLHSSIDADDIEKGNHQVPFPDEGTPIPYTWRTAGSDEIYGNRSGTLVVWSKLDKIHWTTARGIIDNTYQEVGRIHRHFLDVDRVRIRMASFLDIRPNEPTRDDLVVPNDPLYLMGQTSVSEEPWNTQPMFNQWGDTERYSVNVGNREETIEVKYSIVKREALKTDLVTQNPGDTNRGRHARHNIGVSVVREDREIVLEDAFLREGGSAENPQNRWWGCEVQFSRGSDELFGVDHNKQMVANFTQAAKTLARDDRANQLILDEMGIDEDIIHRIVGDIRDKTRAMMSEIRQMFAQKREGRNTSKSTTEKAVRTSTDADRSAIKSGRETRTKTDIERENIPSKEREANLVLQFIKAGRLEQDAQELARTLIEEDLSYQFNPEQLDGYLMFNVRSVQGVLHINLNTEHAIYDLIKHLEDDLRENTDENDPAFQSIVAIRLLLSSWARMEDQTESRDDRTRIQDIAATWGRQVDKFLTQLRERDG